MLKGDISNQQSYVIGFRCENNLLHFKDNNLRDKIGNTIKGKFKRAEVNEKVYSLMQYIYWNTEYTVVLIVDEENYTKDLYMKRLLALLEEDV